MCVCVLVTQLCPTLCDPMDCSPPGSSVHGILQARILEWVAIPFSRGSSWPRDQTPVSYIAGRFFTIWATREAHGLVIYGLYLIEISSLYAHFMERFFFFFLSQMGFEFCQKLFCVCWDEHTVFILQFVNIVYHVDWFMNAKESLPLWNKSHSIMVWSF